MNLKLIQQNIKELTEITPEITNIHQLVFQEDKEHEKGFGDYYKDQIRPEVEKFENNRVEKLKEATRNISITCLTAPLLTVLCVLGVFKWRWNDELTFTLLIVAYIGFFVWCSDPITSYRKSVKFDIFKKIFKFFGDDFHYSPNGISDFRAYAISGLFDQFNRRHTEDFISGSYKGVKVHLVEARLDMETGSGKNKSVKRIFKGVLVLLSMNKNFKGHTLVVTDKGKLRNWSEDKGKYKKFENINLEDPYFEQLFEVYSTDQIESRYLLTTSFMQRLIDLSKAFGDRKSPKIEAAFYGNHLLIKIPHFKNLFEPGSILKPATFIEDSKEVLEEMSLIFNIIDTLKLDEKTGL